MPHVSEPAAGVPQSLRILILEDNTLDAELEVTTLEEAGYVCNWDRVETSEVFLAHLKAQPYDLILADYTLPAFNGLSALEVVRNLGFDLPFIIVSGTVGEELAIDALKMGATDYVLKSRLTRLVPVVQRALQEHEAQRQRLLAEEALRESEYAYRSLVAAVDEGILMVDAQDVIRAANPSAERILGVPVDQLIGRSPHGPRWPTIREDGSPYSQDTHPSRVTLRTGQPCRDVVMGLQKPEGLIWLSVSSQPLFRPGESTPYAVVSSFSEITERKHAEQALQASEQRAQAQLAELAYIYKSAPVGLGLIDRDLRYVRINERLAAFNGRSVDEHIGRTIRDIIPGIAPQVEALCRQVIDTGEPVINVEIHGSTAAAMGVERDWLASYAALKSDDGTVRDVGAVVEDITERKRAEEEVRRLNAELEQRVNERTAQLEAANKELEAFSYSVSHDLRAPLRAMDGFSQVLLEDYADRLDAQGQHYLERVRAATRHMAQLIDDLLSLSRVTRGELQSQSVDLSTLAEAIVAELRNAQPERQVEFVITPGLVARGDPRLLQVALENLLGNAWKYTSTHPHARIELGAVEEKGERVYVVRDDGVGFDMAYRDRLFGAFQRLHGASEFEGTGIGLATVERIIRRHGGRIWAEAAVEQGATFYFTLPER